jgi:hypothetical protein
MPDGSFLALQTMMASRFDNPGKPFGRRSLAVAGLVAICSCLLAAAPGAAPGPSGTELRHMEEEITAGFVGGDADRIARLLSPHMKTYVACRLVAEADGYYGSDQLRLLLRRLFRGRETVRFEVLQPAVPRAGGQASMQALWSFRDSGSTSPEVRLAFTLAPEGNVWRLREIRDLT